MELKYTRKSGLRAALLVGLIALTGCSAGRDSLSFRKNDLECMERAMFFEANRSSRAGMIAVGTVVMNRVESPDFPNTVCRVVAQKGQFAPGIMTRPMKSSAMPDVREAARAVLAGERHPGVRKARFFHTAGYRFPYRNMNYVLVAGGNAFYEKRPPDQVTNPVPPPPSD